MRASTSGTRVRAGVSPPDRSQAGRQGEDGEQLRVDERVDAGDLAVDGVEDLDAVRRVAPVRLADVLCRAPGSRSPGWPAAAAGRRRARAAGGPRRTRGRRPGRRTRSGTGGICSWTSCRKQRGERRQVGLARTRRRTHCPGDAAAPPMGRPPPGAGPASTCSSARARCNELLTAAVVVSSKVATSAAGQVSTSRRISTARWRGGRCCSAATNASRRLCRSADHRGRVGAEQLVRERLQPRHLECLVACSCGRIVAGAPSADREHPPAAVLQEVEADIGGDPVEPGADATNGPRSRAYPRQARR